MTMGRKALALCADCGTPYAGFYDEGETTLLVNGGSTCPSCHGTTLREITADEIGDNRATERQ